MHLVETMAYAGDTPWHGLGSKLGAHEPIDAWKTKAGMDWTLEESAVRYAAYDAAAGTTEAFPEHKVLFRSDNRLPLAVVSKRYQVVQPGEILEFYRDLTEIGGFELETAGVLREGRKFWALAKTGQTATLRGRDRVDGYLLLATACDGTLATTAQFTSVRVVCNNTLAIALGDTSGAVKVSHRSRFDGDKVKRQLGITVSSWDRFVEQMTALADCEVDPDAVEGVLRRVLSYGSPSGGGAGGMASDRAVKTVSSLYQGEGKGALLPSSRHTAWGLLNSITEYVDFHRRARSGDHRLEAAWFGQGAQIKQRAWYEVAKLIG